MIANKWARIGSVLCILFFGLLIGCGDDEKADNNNKGNNGSGIKEDTGVKEDTGSGIEADYRSEYQLRFTSFAFTSESPGKGLNGTLADNFDQDLDYPVIVLIDMAELDVAKNSVNVRGGSGLKTDAAGSYKWDEETDLAALAPGKIEANGALDVNLPTLDFVATFPDQNGDPLKTIIPIKGLTLTGHLSAKEDGSEPTIDDGVLTGYVTLKDGEETKVMVPMGGNIAEVPLEFVFNKKRINYDSTGKGGEPDAWLLTATFTAVETKIVD